MKPDTRSEEELFDQARQEPDARSRRVFLDRACAGQPELRARVEALLAAAADADRFFAETRPALILPAASTPTRLHAPSDKVATSSPGEEALGTRIGRYKLLEKIGEGGWGVVYLAEQEEPVRRSVALKIIKIGMETKSVIARFEAERQALAMMNHPHIARVYDAGATDRGPPYFVMELVHGVKITHYCDEHRLGLTERLHLFIQVCHAIQHAHQKGIIHGDIKPSNIMIAQQDEAPVPKVIDFGIAKATEARLSDRLLFTSYIQLIGTPAYMSPEQADVSGLDIDTRSDIYSLGVLLYELLTGKTPFEQDELLEAGLDGMRRILREKEPARPSVRVATLPPDERARTAEDCQLEPGRLVSQLRGDLDWIVMKALEKDRGRRYETANGLALEIQHYLNNEPVIAQPPSRFYRLRKLVRRNRVVFAAGTAVAAALVAGLGTSTWLFLREREARERAVAAEQQQARLRHEAETREKISQASLLVSQDRFEEADKLLSQTPVQQSTVEGATVLRFIAEWYAYRDQWRQAADRLDVLLQVNQLDGNDVATLDYLRAGTALIEAGDTNAFERFRQGAIARFGATPCPFADRIVKITLLLPASDRLLDSLKPLTDQTYNALVEADQAGDVFTAAWRAVALGLLEYRRGNDAKAVEWCRRCLAYPGTNAPRTATAEVILAMAYHRLGRDAEALPELRAGSDIIERKFRGRLDFGGPVQGFWFDWVFARIVQRECLSVLESAATPRSP